MPDDEHGVSADEYELAEAALSICNKIKIDAVRVLRNECGWTLRRALFVLQRIQAYQ